METKLNQAIQDYVEILKDIGEENETADNEEVLDELQEILEEGIRFDGIAVKTLPEETAKKLKGLKQLEALSFANCKLVGIDSLPALPGLKGLDLSDNSLKGEEIAKVVAKFPNLHSLLLGGNHVKTLAELECLKALKNLENLDLFNNPVTNLKDYRATIFKDIPTLKSLDYKDAEGNDLEVDEGDDDEFEDGEEEDDFIEDEEDQAGPKPLKKPKFNPSSAQLDDADDDDGEEEFLEDGDEEEED